MQRNQHARVTSLYEVSPVATNSRIQSSFEALACTTRYGTVTPQRYGSVVQSGTKRHQLANSMWCVSLLQHGTGDKIKHWQLTYKRNIEVRSRSICRRGKPLSTACSQCASVAVVIQHAIHMHRTVFFICGLSGSSQTGHIISQRHDFRLKKKCIVHKTCVQIFSTTSVWNVSHSKTNSRSIVINL